MGAGTVVRGRHRQPTALSAGKLIGLGRVKIAIGKAKFHCPPRNLQRGGTKQFHPMISWRNRLAVRYHQLNCQFKNNVNNVSIDSPYDFTMGKGCRNRGFIG